VLKLTIPEQDLAQDSGQLARPADVEQWLAALPVMNAVRSLEEVRDALGDMNRTRLKPQLRLQLLELYRKPIADLTREALRRKPPVSLPLPPTLSALVGILDDLQHALAYGYKAAIVDLAGQRLSGAVASELARAIHHGIRHLTGVMLERYRVYRPLPAGLWSEMHQLYRYARSLDLHRKPVADGLNQAVPLNDVDQAYVQALLLGLANPYHHPSGHIVAVDAYLDRYARLAKFLPEPDAGGRQCRFLIEPEQDRAGMPCPGKLPAAGWSGWVLDSRPLVRRAHLHLTAMQTGMKDSPTGLGEQVHGPAAEQLLRRLIIAWGVTPARRFTRVGRQDHDTLAVGLDAVNFILNGERAFELNPEHISESDRGGVAERVEQGRTITRIKCQVLDECATGMRIQLDRPGTAQLAVGELVTFQNRLSVDGWAIGVVRWLQQADSGQTEAGVHLLGTAGDAVATRPVLDGSQGAAPFKPAVRLPAVVALKQAESLLAAPGTFTKDRTLFVETPEQLRMVRCTRLLEGGRVFDWFEFSPIDL